MKSYEHALKLLSKRTPGASFVIDAAAVRDPGGAFERWIKESYQ
ncbi:MAG: hypothetical protein P8Y94_03680 [Acidobacteriota bacterium]